MKNKKANPYISVVKMGKTYDKWKTDRRKKGLSTAIPKVKKCVNCEKRRVKNHHFLCKICWENNKRKK